jgi:hypothetical protein
MITKVSMIREYKKVVRECKAELKNCSPDDLGIPAIQGNMAAAEHWIKFLSDPDVPEQGDPEFDAKMAKLKVRDAARARESKLVKRAAAKAAAKAAKAAAKAAKAKKKSVTVG